MCCPAASCEFGDLKSVGSVLVQKSGRVDDDVRISALDVFFGKDRRKSRYIRRSVGAAPRRRCWRSQKNLLVEKWTCLHVLETEFFQGDPMILMNEKGWTTWKSNQNIVMHEEIVQNIVIDEELVHG